MSRVEADPEIGPTEREINAVLSQASALAKDRVSLLTTQTYAQPIAASLPDWQSAEAHIHVRLEALEDAVRRLAYALDRLQA